MKGCKLWNPVTQKVELKRDVVFDEASMLKKFQQAVQDDGKSLSPSVQVELETCGESTDQ